MKKILTIAILSFLVSMNVSATEEKWVRLLPAEDSKYPGYFYKIFVDLDSIKTGEEWGMNGELFYKQLNTFEKMMTALENIHMEIMLRENLRLQALTP